MYLPLIKRFIYQNSLLTSQKPTEQLKRIIYFIARQPHISYVLIFNKSYSVYYIMSTSCQQIVISFLFYPFTFIIVSYSVYQKVVHETSNHFLLKLSDLKVISPYVFIIKYILGGCFTRVHPTF